MDAFSLNPRPNFVAFQRSNGISDRVFTKLIELWNFLSSVYDLTIYDAHLLDDSEGGCERNLTISLSIVVNENYSFIANNSDIISIDLDNLALAPFDKFLKIWPGEGVSLKPAK